MAKDLTQYIALRSVTRDAATAAQTAFAAETTAEKAVEDAQATLDEAKAASTAASRALEDAEQAENAEAIKQGLTVIAPTD